MLALSSVKFSSDHSDHCWRVTGKLKDLSSLSKFARASSIIMSF